MYEKIVKSVIPVDEIQRVKGLGFLRDKKIDYFNAHIIRKKENLL